MNSTQKELEAYIAHKDLELKHPSLQRIPLRSGNLILTENGGNVSEYVFDIGWDGYRRLGKIQSECKLEYKNKQYECEILELTPEDVISKQVVLKIKNFNAKQKIESCNITIDLGFINEREKAALEQLKLGEEFVNLRKILFGNQDILKSAKIECEFENADFNPEQKTAIQYATGVKDMYLIWGPPGTGKTTIVPELVTNYIKHHKNQKGTKPTILVCSYTNKAVDNIVTKLFRKFSIVRFAKSTLGKDYKDAFYEEQLKAKKRQIEEEYSAKIRPWKDELQKIDSEIEANDNEIAIRKKKCRQLQEEIDQTMVRIDDVGNHTAKLLKQLKDLKERQSQTAKLLKDIENQIKIIREGKISTSSQKFPPKHTDANYKMHFDSMGGLQYRELEMLCDSDQIKLQHVEEEYNGKMGALRAEKNTIEEKLREDTRELDALKDEKDRLYREREQLNKGIHDIDERMSKIKTQLDIFKTRSRTLLNIVGKQIDIVQKPRILGIFQKLQLKRQDSLYNRYVKQMEKMEYSELRVLYDKRQQQERAKDSRLRRKLESKVHEKQALLKELAQKKVNMESIEGECGKHLDRINGYENKIKSIEEELTVLKTLKDFELLYIIKLAQQRHMVEDERKVQGDLDNKTHEKHALKGELEHKSLEIQHIKEACCEITIKINDQKAKSKRITEETIRLLDEEKEQKISEAELLVLTENEVIATTNLRLCSKLFNDIHFDLVIMDEAGAIDVPGAIIPIVRADKTILLGDHKQLPPVIAGNHLEIRKFLDSNPFIRKSIFEKLQKSAYGDSRRIMLKSQYRMREEIAEFVSNFYEEALETPSTIKGFLHECDDPILSNQYPMICLPRNFRSARSDSSWVCDMEIKLVKNIVKMFKEHYGNDIEGKIGIITPFRPQHERIRESMPQIECGTVHKFQGGEKEIIIYATTKYHQEKSSPMFKEEDGCRLLNVAVSRAKEKFVVIGSQKLFDDVPIYTKLYKHISTCGHIAKKGSLRGYDPINKCNICGMLIKDKSGCCYDCITLKTLRDMQKDIPRDLKAEDGDLLRSPSETRIDEWFFHHGIEHQVEIKVPVEDKLMYCDWLLPKGDTFVDDIYVEYWGMMKEPEYAKGREVKEKIYRRNNLKLLSIEPEDMQNMHEILEYKLGQFKKSVIPTRNTS